MISIVISNVKSEKTTLGTNEKIKICFKIYFQESYVVDSDGSAIINSNGEPVINSDLQDNYIISEDGEILINSNGEWIVNSDEREKKGELWQKKNQNQGKKR